MVNGSYISQLNVTISNDLDARTIECVHDVGSHQTIVSTAVIHLTTGI